ncbi:serine/threonine-protein kinase STY8-like isoform X2 [Solanum tuberosum]|uniref:serine/threonine-protein kinase STY8-like isoform X2 n=1 Tax=Solanum tuberosum TaxID=4113 RepID=UPI0003D26FBB|nr:PREDICTED: serine/threonine-protein kinase STY8-like isoform X2 [Solanum tuberosum]
MSGSEGSSGGGEPATSSTEKKKKEKARVSRTSLILWHAHQNDKAAVRKLLEEDRTLVQARDYDNRTPLHVAALHGWIDIAKCLIEYGADVNSQDRWRNTGQDGSHFEPRAVPPPLPKKCDWEIDPTELDFSNSAIIGKGSFGEIIKACWRGTPVAVKRILPNLSDDQLVIQDFRHEVNLLVKLRHPNVVQFLGAVTEKKPLMLITEYLRGGDLHQYLKGKGALSPSTAVNFALDIARGLAYLHNEPNVVIHRDLKPRNVLLVNSSADHLKVGDFGLSKLIRVQNSHDVYKMTGETGSYRYMAPEVFKHRKYDKKVDVFSFAMIFYEMLEGDPPLSHYEPYEAAKYVAEGHRPMFRAKGLTPELKELVEQCWAKDVNKRPSFLEILKTLEKIKLGLPSDNHWNIFT